MYDLVLVNPPRPLLVAPDAQAPLGILYLAATAREAGLAVAVANLAAVHPENTRALADALPLARCYGITGTCFDIDAINTVAGLVKALDPGCRVLVGGPVALSYGHMDVGHVDTVHVGEGEGVIAHLATAPDVPFASYGRASNLDALPPPARDLWPGALGGDVFNRHRRYFPGGSATVMSSRGCPYSCGFCAGPALRQQAETLTPTAKVRYAEPARFVSDLEQIVTDRGVRQFRVCDESFTSRRSHVAEICKRIRASHILDHGLGLALRVSINRKPNDLGLFQDLASAGCREVAIGVETADDDCLHVIANKGSHADALAALAHARAAGLATRALMMTGLPGSTSKTATRDIAFIRSGAADAVALTVFTPLPGCAIAMYPERFGCTLRADVDRRTVCLYGPGGRNEVEPTIDCDTISREDLRAGMIRTIEAAEAADVVGKG